MNLIKCYKLLWIALFFFSCTFFLPIWKISLKAPQYPVHDPGMYIYVNDIKPVQTHDIEIINLLNHYIGMKEIHKNDFKEFEYMPTILVGIIISGSLVILLRNKKVLILWFFFVLLLFSLGLYDFYKWEYNYGHTLNPNAAIKVPGMNYQPPFIGKKKLLNMEASSYPSIGSFCLFIGVGLIFYVILKKDVKT